MKKPSKKSKPIPEEQVDAVFSEAIVDNVVVSIRKHIESAIGGLTKGQKIDIISLYGTRYRVNVRGEDQRLIRSFFVSATLDEVKDLTGGKK